MRHILLRHPGLRAPGRSGLLRCRAWPSALLRDSLLRIMLLRHARLLRDAVLLWETGLSRPARLRRRLHRRLLTPKIARRSLSWHAGRLRRLSRPRALLRHHGLLRHRLSRLLRPLPTLRLPGCLRVHRYAGLLEHAVLLRHTRLLRPALLRHLLRHAGLHTRLLWYSLLRHPRLLRPATLGRGTLYWGSLPRTTLANNAK